jgi:putative ABC transport system permease protein
MANPDLRPSVFFFMSEDRIEKFIDENPSRSFNMIIKAQNGITDNLIPKLTAIFNEFVEHQDAVVKSLETEQQNCYMGERGFRDSIIIGSLIILLITTIGLLGYTANEANRRSKELAIRRINGADLPSILKMFIYDLETIVIPAVGIGLIAAWFTANKWMMNFVGKIQLHWGIFVGCSLSIIVLVAIIAVFNYTRMINRNPVESLRYE